MTKDSDYLYNNSDSTAEDRLRGLEAIEDGSTIELLDRLGVAPQWHCLEIGAGAGSIARWLAQRTGPLGRTVATDLDTSLLDPTRYEVWRHDLLRDELPEAAFDLVHLRHVLIHIDRSLHPAIWRALWSTLKPGGVLLAEESDLQAWQPCADTPEPIRTIFAAGVAITLAIYRSRAMNPSLGAELQQLIVAAGFTPTARMRRNRRVTGCSFEAAFHQRSARQLAKSIRHSNAVAAAKLGQFAKCFDMKELAYESRATISVSATRSRGD